MNKNKEALSPTEEKEKSAETTVAPKPVVLETKRLVLRPIVDEDADDIFAYCSEPNVGPHAGWEPHKDKVETLEIMHTLFMNDKNIFGIVPKELDKVVGTIGLIADPRRENPEARMLGYALSETQWNKGLMTEAAQAIIRYGFEEKKLRLITCTCYTYNLRSRRVIEKCGFHYEGRLRQGELRFDGVLLDLESFSLTREEWLSAESHQ